MADATILDTGPLVAYLDADEHHHAWAIERFRELPPKFLTCEPVLTEACYLLGFDPRVMEQLDRFFENGWLTIPFQFTAERQPVMALMRKYHSVPMSLADACLVRLAEMNPETSVLTLDRHFRIYRKNGRERIRSIMP